MKTLPEYFAIKGCDDPRRPKYIDWLNEKYGECWEGSLKNLYYGYDGNRTFNGTASYCCISSFKNNPTVLTLDEREKMVGNQESNSVEIDLIKNKRNHYTYTTTHKRSDGVRFAEKTIDGTPVEEIEKQIKEHRAEAKRLQGLIHSHNALFPKSK